MKIAISADGRDIGKNNVTSFCGCSFFLIVDTKANSLRAVENKNRGIPSRVGRTAGKLVSREGVDAVITSNIGPQAWDIFKGYGIKVYHGEDIVNDVIRQLEEERLHEITKSEALSYNNWIRKKLKTETKK